MRHQARKGFSYISIHVYILLKFSFHYGAIQHLICPKKHLNILQFRGTRARKQSKNRKKQPYQRVNNRKEYIKVRITSRQPPSIASLQRDRNQFVIKRVPYAKSYEVPSILSTNIRSLSNKVDELNEVATLNKSDIICITRL